MSVIKRPRLVRQLPPLTTAPEAPATSPANTGPDNRAISSYLAEKQLAWDFCVVSDGSGSGWNLGCGWASVLVTREQDRKLFTGGTNCGTVNLGEILGVVMPLYWATIHLPPRSGRAARAVVITDSQYTATTGNQVVQSLMPGSGPNFPLWAMLAAIARKGLKIQFVWERRRSLMLNVYADALAGRARQAVQAVGLYDEDIGRMLSPYDFNAIDALPRTCLHS